MNNNIIKSVNNRILKTMMEDEKELKVLLNTETPGVPDEQLDGLFVKIEQLLGRIMVNQNKIMLLQSIGEENGNRKKWEIVKKLAAEGKLTFDESTGDIKLLGKTPEENDKILNKFIYSSPQICRNFLEQWWGIKPDKEWVWIRPVLSAS